MTASSITETQGKLFPPSSDVVVPRMPSAPHDADSGYSAGFAATQTEALKATAENIPSGSPDASAMAANQHATDAEKVAQTTQAGAEPAKIDHTESNWADSTQPAPDKRTARSSIL